MTIRELILALEDTVRNDSGPVDNYLTLDSEVFVLSEENMEPLEVDIDVSGGNFFDRVLTIRIL
jgi:hypothetical protein